MVPLTPLVVVVVHAIDTDAHPSQPPGWRWAVMVGGRPPADLDWCANAGWCPTEQEAWLEGETCGATACRALRMLGVPAAYDRSRLDHDPIPAGCNRVHTLGG